MGSIHQIIGAGPHGFQKQALGGDRFEDRVIVRRGQRMLPPGFLVAAGEHLVVAFQKQDFIVAALALEVVKADLQTMNADMQVSQEEYAEISTIKPLFLNADYK